MNGFESLSGKVFIVTGGAGKSAGGTGSAISRRLIDCGASVAVWDIAGEECSAVKSGNLLYVHSDVRKVEDVENALKATLGKFGKVDGLVNNAFWHADVQPPLHEMSLEDKMSTSTLICVLISLYVNM